MSRQISFRRPEELLAQLDRQARLRRRDRSSLIREILERHVSVAATFDPPYSRVRDLVGSLTGGPPDLGAAHRDHLVGLAGDRPFRRG